VEELIALLVHESRNRFPDPETVVKTLKQAAQLPRSQAY